MNEAVETVIPANVFYAALTVKVVGPLAGS
jgi:hypothetical protein